MSSLGGGPLLPAREEALSAVTDRMPSVSSLRGTHVSNLGGGPLFIAREKVLSTEPERRPSVLSLRGGPLCRT